MTSEKPVNVKVGNARAPPAPMGAMETMSAMSGSPPAELSTKAINQIVSGLQQASQSGLTQLPSRDIPMSTQQLTQDVQIKPNYVPAANNKDYIEQHDNYQSLLNKKKSESEAAGSIGFFIRGITNPTSGNGFVFLISNAIRFKVTTKTISIFVFT